MRLGIIGASTTILAASTAMFAYLGYLRMFTGFAPYDDEGYMLVSLRSFISGQALYDKVVMQYGPFYFEVFGFLGALGVPFDLDSGRLVTLAIWLAIALLSGVAIFVFTRSLALGLGTQLITFATAVTLTREPMHPGGVVLLLVIGIDAVALISARRWSGPWPFVAIGGFAAAAILTKVNVGAFAAISIAFACVVTFPSLARIWPVKLATAAVFVAVPFLLMKSNLDQGWAQRYALHVALCALALVVVTSGQRPDLKLRLPRLGWMIAAGAAVAVVVLAIALFTGSSPGGVLHGILLDPLQQPRAYEVPLMLPNSTLKWDALGLGGALLWTFYRRLVQRSEVAFEGALRLLIGLYTWLTLLGGISIPGVFQLNALGSRYVLPLAFAWVIAAPRGNREGYEDLDFARALVAAIAILQSLHAYPVAGSQGGFSLLTLVPVGAICVADGLAQLGLARIRLQVATTVLFLAIIVSWLPPAWQQIQNGYDSSVALGLPGASRVRVPAVQGTLLREVTQSVRDNCDTFISLPGLDSFYIFGQLKPPTPPTRWMWLTQDVVHQRAAVEASNRINRLCVIENDYLIQIWTRGRPPPNGPLLEFVRQNFVPVYSFGTTNQYTVLMRRQ